MSDSWVPETNGNSFENIQSQFSFDQQKKAMIVQRSPAADRWIGINAHMEATERD